MQKVLMMMMVRVMVILMIRIVWSLAKLAPSPLGIRSRTRRGGQKWPENTGQQWWWWWWCWWWWWRWWWGWCRILPRKMLRIMTYFACCRALKQSIIALKCTTWWCLLGDGHKYITSLTWPGFPASKKLSKSNGSLRMCNTGNHSVLLS